MMYMYYMVRHGTVVVMIRSNLKAPGPAPGPALVIRYLPIREYLSIHYYKLWESYNDNENNNHGILMVWIIHYKNENVPITSHSWDLW